MDDDVEEDEGDNAEDEVEDDKVEDDDVAEDEVEDDGVKGREDDDVEEDRSQDCDQHFLRACAVDMHLDMSQEPFYAEIYRENAGTQIEHPDQAPAETIR